MKIVFIARSTLFLNRGGDTVQAENTCKYLRRLGVDVEIKLANEKISYEKYDLLHFFNVIRPADILKHARSGKPYVVSTIFVNYTEFERRARRGISGALFKVLPEGFIEYAKALARIVKNNDALVSIEYLWKGHSRSVKEVIRNARLLLPNSLNEYNRLYQKYAIHKDFKVIPNAIDMELFNKREEQDVRDEYLILCVGRIEGRKNQLNLIAALNETKYRLCIIGSATANQMSYYNTCVKAAGTNIQFINTISQAELIEFYGRAKVHVLPSWFETTGLSSLEAAVMGCNIVITAKGDTEEYFGKLAYYCDPDSIDSIRNAVDRAAKNEFDEDLRKKIIGNYTWEIAARKTLEGYNQALFNEEK